MASMKVYHIGVMSACALCQLFLLVLLYACAFSDSYFLKESAEWLDQKELDDEARIGPLGPGRHDRTGHRASLISLADAYSDRLCIRNTSRLLSIVMLSA